MPSSHVPRGPSSHVDRLLSPNWLALIIGGYSVWGLFHLTTGVAFWDLLTITGSIQATLRDNYSYGRWLFYNAYDILAFAGVPVGTLFVVAIIRAWKNRLHRQHPTTAIPALVVSAILLLVNLAGVSPGEVGRLWLYWTTGMAVTVALSSRQRSASIQLPALSFQLLLPLLALQSLWMTLFLRVSPTGMPSYTPRQPKNTPIANPTDVAFEDNIRLVGYDVAPITIGATRESPLHITLNWEAATRPDRPYTVFVHLINHDGTIIAQHDAMPAGNTLPTSCWLPGEVIEDVHPLEIPVETPPGDYTIRVGLYYLPTLERLSIVDGGEGDIFHLPRTITVTLF